MKSLLVALSLMSLSFSALAQGLSISPSVKYKVTAVTELGKKPVKSFSFQKIKLISGEGLSKIAISSINFELEKSKDMHRMLANQCREFSQGDPWQYESKIAKIMLTKNYLSIVFSRQTVCGGSPEFERDPLVFSTKDGKFIPTEELMSEAFPGHKIPENIQSDKQLTPLDQELTETLIEDSKKSQNNFDETCNLYLRESTYRIWMEDKKMVLFPEFMRPESRCQREYFINLR